MFDLATAKTRLGLTDTSKDALVTLALNSALAVAERFCDRKLAYATETVNFYNYEGDTLFLPRYPIEALISTEGLPEVKVHHRLGILELDAVTFAEEVTISYSGGYRVFPPDLELALWGVFDSIWPGITGASAAAAIDSVTIPDVGTIRYTNNSGSSVADANANVLGSYYSILDTYRRQTC